ncbi:MAG: sel1 repeat family protein, partial [Leptotrichiaceae bacterium]|nr:sel1 repeat family protein [Leptotrichiaceae bacterium]
MRKKISVLLLIFAFSTAIISCFNKNDNASSENKNEVKKENLEEQNLSTGGAASGDIFNLGKTQSKDESQNDKIDNLTMDEQKVLIENEIDPIKVSEAIKKAESGEKEAIMSLSQLYYNLKDNEKVKRFLKLGVDKNYPEAIYNLAVIYKNEGNTVEANKLISKLPKNTNVNLPAGADEYNKAITFMKSKKYVEAKKQFEIAYKKGIKDVDIRIALLNKELKNTSEALKWFKIANKRGVKGTNYEIGAILYDSGKLKDSRPYLLKAYNEGEKILAMPIAATYQNENNTTEALKWFKIAAKNGNKDAKNIIAQIEKP